MAERTEERTRERESAVDPEIQALLDDPSEHQRSAKRSRNRGRERADRTESAGLRARLRERRRGLFSLFSLRPFLVILGLTLVGGFVGGAVPFLGSVTGLLGVFAATFLGGALSSERRYIESGLAGAVTAGITLVLGNISLAAFSAVQGLGIELGVIGASAGVLVALVGHYFGRDLRNGLTMDV